MFSFIADEVGDVDGQMENVFVAVCVVGAGRTCVSLRILLFSV